MATSLDKVRYGFEIWKAADPMPDLPPAFVVTIERMGGDVEGQVVPSYYLAPEYILTGLIMTDEAAARILDEAAPLFPWVSGPPFLAVDGRILQYLMTTVLEAVDASLGTVASLDPGELEASIRHAHDQIAGKLLAVVQETQAGIDTAEAVGVPLWSMLKASLPEAQGGLVPTYVMLPSTVLEQWAQVYVESGLLMHDAQASILSGAPQGLVAEYEKTRTPSMGERLSGPVILGVAACGLAVFGMVVAVWTGWPTRKVETYGQAAG